MYALFYHCLQNSWTPLLVATKNGHFDIVRSVLKQEPNVNATDKVISTFVTISSLHFQVSQDAVRCSTKTVMNLKFILGERNNQWWLMFYRGVGATKYHILKNLHIINFTN